MMYGVEIISVFHDAVSLKFPGCHFLFATWRLFFETVKVIAHVTIYEKYWVGNRIIHRMQFMYADCGMRLGKICYRFIQDNISVAKLRQIISLGDDNAYDLVYLWLLAPIVDVGKEYAVLLELSVNIDEHMGCGHA